MNIVGDQVFYTHQVFYAQGGITVSKTTFIAPNYTFSMANIASCRVVESNNNTPMKILRFAAIAASVVTGIALAILASPIVGGIPSPIVESIPSPIVGSIPFPIVGGILGIGGVMAALILIRPRMYHLYLGTNSGQVEAIRAADEDYILRIERAVDHAIVARD